MCPHGSDQLARARCQRDAFLQDIVDNGDGQAFQQRDALAQRRRELDLAAHRTLGDGRNPRLDADEVGKLVDTFLTNHGRVHVGEKQPLAATDHRLHDDVDRQVSERFAQPLDDRAAIFRVGKWNVGGNAIEQPLRGAGPGQNRARSLEQRAIERRRRGIADQRCDERHDLAFRRTWLFEDLVSK